MLLAKIHSLIGLINCSMPYSKFYIHATNVHQGGGRALLSALLQAIKVRIVFSVDERMTLPACLDSNVHIRRVKSSIWQRFLSEKRLAREVEKEDAVLCFGNLPPLFKLRGFTVVFLQNRYLVEDISLNAFPFFVRLRLMIERRWFLGRLANVDKFIVQTPTMKRLLKVKIKQAKPVQVLPFVAKPHGYLRSATGNAGRSSYNFDFVYVATGEPHKNHRTLIDAWCILAKEGVFPSLCLTLDRARFSELCFFIEEMQKQYGLNIVNMGLISHSEVLDLYEKSAAAIYPSKFESFGLPLIEARQAGLPVLASELDFVRDVLDPEQVFDPNSPTSIARAVKRFKGVDEPPLPLLDATQFLALILKKDV